VKVMCSVGRFWRSRVFGSWSEDMLQWRRSATTERTGRRRSEAHRGVSTVVSANAGLRQCCPLPT